jgi:hypothetical protein
LPRDFLRRNDCESSLLLCGEAALESAALLAVPLAGGTRLRLLERLRRGLVDSFEFGTLGGGDLERPLFRCCCCFCCCCDGVVVAVAAAGEERDFFFNEAPWFLAPRRWFFESTVPAFFKALATAESMSDCNVAADTGGSLSTTAAAAAVAVSVRVPEMNARADSSARIS